MLSSPTAPHVRDCRLDLHVDFKGLRWDGTVELDVRSEEPTIVLHAVDLEIRSVTVDGRPAEFRLHPSDETLRIEPILPGEHTVAIAFGRSAAPREVMGFYRSRFGTSYLLSTQCEATGARRIFPCVDRPDRKTPFRLVVTTDASEEVIGNATVASVERIGAERRWTFHPTPPMATYLFLLAIGTFERVSRETPNATVSALVPPGRADAAAFALDRAGPLLATFAHYYGQAYPFPKLDLIVVPELSSGAMENWGAITFREPNLLVDASTSVAERRDASTTLLHEIAHQWFGNLVTMEWWTDIWLNESFATLMELKVGEFLYPESNVRTDFLAFSRRALLRDGLRHSHPVAAEVIDAAEIAEVFDTISYGKGSSVLRMMEAYLGADRFRDGVRGYLQRFRYGNARTVDLWDALAAATGEPVRTILGPWIDRSGHPVLRVQHDRRGLRLDQRRFLLDGRHESGTWPIPIVGDLDGRPIRFLLTEAERLLETPIVRSLSLNSDAVGFYRVLYDPALYECIEENFARRSPADRWSVLEDLYAFVLSGDVPLGCYDRFLERARAATDFLTVSSATESARRLAEWLDQDVRMQELARLFLAEQFDRLGMAVRPGEPELDTVLRGEIAVARAKLDGGFARQLAEEFVRWERLDPDMRLAVAIARARTGDATVHREMVRALSRVRTESEVSELEEALAWFPSPELTHATLDLIDTPAINRGDIAAIIVAVSKNPFGRAPLWEWLQRHLPRLEEETRGSGYASKIVEDGIPYFGIGRRAEVAQFMADARIPETERGVAAGLEMLDIMERLRMRERAPSSR